MPANLLRMIVQNWVLIVLVFMIGGLIALAFREYRDADDFQEAAQRTGQKSRDLTGGALGIFGAVIMGLFGAANEAGMGIAQLLGEIGAMVGANPFSWAAPLIGVLGWLGLEGIVDYAPRFFIGLVIVILGIAAALKAKNDGMTGGML